MKYLIIMNNLNVTESLSLKGYKRLTQRERRDFSIKENKI